MSSKTTVIVAGKIVEAGFDFVVINFPLRAVIGDKAIFPESLYQFSGQTFIMIGNELFFRIVNYRNINVFCFF